MNRAGILQALERDRRLLLLALEGLDDKTLISQEVVGDWTTKDLLGHVAMWQEVAVQFIADYRRQGVPSSLGLDSDAALDAYNRRGVEERRAWPLERVRERLDASYADLEAAVESLNDEQLHAPLAQPWSGDETTLEQLIANNSFDHNPEHVAQIRRVRDAALRRDDSKTP